MVVVRHLVMMAMHCFGEIHIRSFVMIVTMTVIMTMTMSVVVA